MRVVIADSVVRDLAGAGEVVKLHMLFAFVYRCRHVLLVAESSALVEWVESLDAKTSGAYKKALEFSSRAALTLARDVATVFIDSIAESIWDDPRAVLSIDDALRLLDEPLGVLLENADNDLQFLLKVMSASQRDSFNRAVENRWVEAVHGGGSDLLRRLEGRVSSPAKRLRTFSIFDSDRHHPDELHHDWRPGEGQACQGFDFEVAAKRHIPGRYWRLRRRSIESYMPRRELEIKAGVSQGVKPGAVEAYFRLTREGRWYFNMKKGFKGDERSSRSGDLYGTISSEDRQALYEGFTRTLAERYRESAEDEFDWDHETLEEARESLPLLMRLL